MDINNIHGLHNKDTNCGFTIVEMLVAVTILLVGITGPLIISSKGITVAIFAKNRITATFLAEEALEYVRNTKDSNIISILGGSAVAWDNGFGDATNCFASGPMGNGCAVDVFLLAPNDYVRCSPVTLCDVTFDNLTGRFGHNPLWEPTIFRRTVRVYDDASTPPTPQPSRGDAVRVEVTVEWMDKSTSKSIVVDSTLFSYIE